MHFWIGLFFVPIMVISAVFAYLLFRERYEFRQLSTWAALGTGLAAPIFALWGMTHRDRIQLPLAYNPAFDKQAWLVAIVAALFGLAWLIQSRRRYSALVFLLSFLVAAFWTAVVLPF